MTRTYRNAKGKPTCDMRSIGRADDERSMLNLLTKKQREIVGLMGFAEDDVRAFVERGGRQPV